MTTRSAPGARETAILIGAMLRPATSTAFLLDRPEIALVRRPGGLTNFACRLVECACERLGRSRCAAGFDDRHRHAGEPARDARRGAARHRLVGVEGLPRQAHARSARAGRLARRQPGSACRRPAGRVRRPRDRRDPDHARRLRLGAGDPAARLRRDRRDTEGFRRPLRHHGAARGATRSRGPGDVLRAEPHHGRQPFAVAVHHRSVLARARRRDGRSRA